MMTPSAFEIALAMVTILFIASISAYLSVKELTERNDTLRKVVVSLSKRERMFQLKTLSAKHNRLYDLLGEVKEAMGYQGEIRLFLDETKWMNAGAVAIPNGFDTIIVGKGLLKADLPDNEWKALFAHEVSHLKGRDDMFLRTRLVLQNARAPLLYTAWGMSAAAFLTMALGSQIATFMLLSVSAFVTALFTFAGEIVILSVERRKEIEADIEAFKVAGLGAYISLAEKAFSGGKGGLLSTHPSAEERVRAVVAAAGEMQEKNRGEDLLAG